MKCATKDRNLKQCRRYASNDKFCELHKYMIDYTDEMLEKAMPCSGCLKTYYIEEPFKTCTGCRERVKDQPKEQVTKCAKEGCNFKKSENKYCGKHQLNMFLDETAEQGLTPCKNAVRGCRAQLSESYKYSACEPCLQLDRAKDNKRRGLPIKVTPSEKQCSVCCKMYRKEMFEGIHGETHTCKNCRDANKRADEKRDKEHVNELARKNCAKPERKMVKNAWKESNYEKVAMYCINHRKKLIENDIENYLEHNAENMQKWREANPEKAALMKEQKNNNIDYSYLNYKRNAELKQLVFEFTKEEFITLVKLPCNYCGIMQEKGFNGIDRVDSTIGYIMDNCVSCCAMCNFMKGCLNKYIFIRRVEHIVTYNKLVEGNLYPNSFKHYNPIYSKYITSANARKIEFKIDKSIFTIITNKPCYLCGKCNTEYHQNGLDRINSSIGYLESNVYSCCGNCNYMKNNYTYKEFMDKCLLIYNKLYIDKIKKFKNILENDVITTEIDNEIQEIDNHEIQEKNNIVKGNKLSKTDRTEYNRIKKQKQRQALKDRYGNDEYNKIRAREIAEKRKKRNE
jgi:hypothetical protein